MEDNPKSGIDFEDTLFVAKRKYQVFMDKITPQFNQRWATFAIILLCFVTRIVLKQGYAVLAYLLGLFYLNNIMLYLSRLEDPDDLEEDQNQESFIIPQREKDEYKGFQRKMGEMDFWK